MKRSFVATLLALFTAPAASQVIQAPPAGTEFVMKCTGGAESRWVVAQNANGKLRVERAENPKNFRSGPIWAYMLGDIYDELGTGEDTIRMTRVRGPAAGVDRLTPGARFRFTYRWDSAKGEAERNHVITVQGVRRVTTLAFGEQEVYDVTDDSSSPYHDLRREVAYAPALRMFVGFKVRNNRSKFEQTCELVSLKLP